MKKFIDENYSVKKIKKLEHSEGLSYTGTLYFNSRAVATFEEEGKGAPMQVWYVNSDAESDFMSFAKTQEDSDYSEIDAIVIDSLVVSEIDRKKVMTGRKKKTFFGTNGFKHMFIALPYNEELVNNLRSDYGEELDYIGNEVFDYYPDGVEKVIQVDSE